ASAVVAVVPWPGLPELDPAAVLAAPGGPAAQRPVAVRSALPCAPPETPMNDLIPLADAHCMPRRGASHRLGDARLRELLPQVPGWEAVEDGAAITSTLPFDDYYRTMAFVHALALLAHRAHHHPDLQVHYDRVVVRYSTHDVGGLSENDFICAAKADALTE